MYASHQSQWALEKLLYLKALFQNLFGLGSSDGAVTGDFLVTTDAERTNGVTCLGEHRSLTFTKIEISMLDRPVVIVSLLLELI